MDNSWTFEVQNMVYSRLEAVVMSKLAGSYRNINVTMDDHIISDRGWKRP